MPVMMFWLKLLAMVPILGQIVLLLMYDLIESCEDLVHNVYKEKCTIKVCLLL